MTQLLLFLYGASLYNYQSGFNFSLSNIFNNPINTLYPEILGGVLIIIIHS